MGQEQKSDAGCAQAGAPWTCWNNQGCQGGVAQADPDDSASGDFTVAPGTYRVSAAWTTCLNRQDPGPVHHQTRRRDAGRRRSALRPAIFTDAGAIRRDLGGTGTVAGTTPVVRLTGSARGFLDADAVRVERVG